MKGLKRLQAVAAMAAAITVAVVVPAKLFQGAQEKFEVASIRFKPRGDGGRGVPDNAGACPNLRIQIDPSRLSIPGVTLNELIVLAYPEWTNPYANSYGNVSNAISAAGSACANVTAGGILSGGPGWVRSDLWDIEATLPQGPVDYKVSPPRELP